MKAHFRRLFFCWCDQGLVVSCHFLLLALTTTARWPGRDDKQATKEKPPVAETQVRLFKTIWSIGGAVTQKCYCRVLLYLKWEEKKILYFRLPNFPCYFLFFAKAFHDKENYLIQSQSWGNLFSCGVFFDHERLNHQQIFFFFFKYFQKIALKQ